MPSTRVRQRKLKATAIVCTCGESYHLKHLRGSNHVSFSFDGHTVKPQGTSYTNTVGTARRVGTGISGRCAAPYNKRRVRQCRPHRSSGANQEDISLRTTYQVTTRTTTATMNPA